MHEAWMAGFFDGEGHASVHPLRMKKGTWYQASMGIRNTHLPTIEAVCAYLETEAIPHHLRKEGRGTKHKVSYWINVTGMANVKRFASIMLPHSITKQRQLSLIIEWCDSRANAKHGAGYTQREMEIVTEFQTLNRRGNPDSWEVLKAA